MPVNFKKDEHFISAENRGKWSRLFWNTIGTAFLVLGILGILLPVLPTTPFLLLAAASYLKGSPRMYRWMMTNAYLGRYLTDYRSGKGIPRSVKITAVMVLWLGIAISIVFFVDNWPVRIVLVVIALGVSIHLAIIKTKNVSEHLVNAKLSEANSNGPVVQLEKVEKCNDELVERWLYKKHVRKWWGDPNEALNELVAIQNSAGKAIILANGRKVGLVVWQHPTRQELDDAGLNDIPTTVVDIDIMIGEEDAIGKGVGSATICLVADQSLIDQSVPYVIAATSTENVASRRAFVKAGFRVDREFDDPQFGRFLLMKRERNIADFGGEP